VLYKSLASVITLLGTVLFEFFKNIVTPFCILQKSIGFRGLEMFVKNKSKVGATCLISSCKIEKKFYYLLESISHEFL